MLKVGDKVRVTASPDRLKEIGVLALVEKEDTGVVIKQERPVTFGDNYLPLEVLVKGCSMSFAEEDLELIKENKTNKNIKDLKVKETNPKDSVGIRKWRQYAPVPCAVIWELGVAMLEGARKYGRHNYRKAGVRASVYFDAAKGHIDQWWEGEDIDPDSGIHHITKAIATLVVLRDGMLLDKWEDDRPPKAKLDMIRNELQEKVEEIIDRYPDAKEPFTELNITDV